MLLHDVIIFVLIFLCKTIASDEIVYGCGGFIRSTLPIDYANIKMRLYTSSGHLKYETECAPNNGYYMIPVYSKGQYRIVVDPPTGWEFDPQVVEINIDGITDACTLGNDLNFNFKGFSVIGKVCSGPKCSPVAKNNDIGLFAAADNAIKPLMTSKTDEHGEYTFRGVPPGQYVVRNLDESICVPNDQVVRLTVSQTSFEVSSDLLVTGYGLTGQVVDSGKPVRDAHVYLFAVGNNKLHAENCDVSSPSDLPQEEGASFVCSTLSTDKGTFSFSCLEPGKYFVTAEYEVNGLKFDLSPSRINLQIVDKSVDLKEPFSVNGFSLSGQVLWSKKGRAMQGVDVYFDNKKLNKPTDEKGFYQLSGVKPGQHTLFATGLNVEFDIVKVDLQVDRYDIPNLFPTRFNLCGRFKRDTVDLTQSILKQRKLLLTDAQGLLATISITTDENGAFCKMIQPGSYILEPQILAEEKKSGFSIVPRQASIIVKDQPVLDVTFDQFRAKVSGIVKCLDSCESVTLNLFILTEQKKLLKSIKLVEVVGSQTFEFDGISNAKYEIEIIAPAYCWKLDKIEFMVDNADVHGLVIEQSGIVATLSLSHDAKLKYTPLKNLAASDYAQLHKGTNSLCLPVAGDYEFKLHSCHIFEGTSEASVLKYNTINDSSYAIKLVAIKHLVKGAVTSIETVSDLSIRIKSLSKPIDASNVVVPTILEEKSSSTASKKKTYHFEYLADKDEELEVEPRSGIFLFEPERRTISVADDCVDNVDFIAQKGHFLDGAVTPALDGVEVTLISEADPQIQYETVTNDKGIYRFGPLKSLDGFKIDAQKSGYILSPVEKKFGHFNAFKLSELTLKTLDVSQLALPGVLLSVSGKNYRSNNITGENGTVTFVGLSPGQYFIRPILKEYIFEPITKLVDVAEGSTVSVELAGKRFAYSCTGSVRHLAGQPVVNIGLEAIPGRGQCQISGQLRPAHEEAVTSDDGMFKIKGLLPGCSYTLQIRPGQNLPTTVPLKHLITVTDKDSTQNDFILKPEITTTEISGRVECDKNLLQYLKVVICKSSSSESPLHILSLQSSSIFFFPMLPLDNTTYVVRLENALPAAQYEPVEYQETMLKADTSFHFITYRFDPKKKAMEQEHTRGSYSAIPLTILLILLVYNYDQVYKLLISLTQAFLTFSMEPNSHMSKILQKVSGKKSSDSRRSSPAESSDQNADLNTAENTPGFANRKRIKLRKT